MAKTVDTNKGGNGAATAAIMRPGAIPAEPELEGPANPASRRVLGIKVKVLPSKHEAAEKPFPFRSAEQYENLEKKPVRHILSRILSKASVYIVALGTLIAAPFVQIYLNDKIDGGLYTYFSQQAENLSNVFAGIREYSSGIFLGFAATVAAVAISIPFVSNKPREAEICEREQDHPSEEVRKAHKSARGWSEIHRMVSKFRGASLLAALPLAGSDFWAYASGGFKGSAEFFQGMSTYAQVAVGAFLALIAASIFTYRQRNKAILNAGDKEYAYNVQNEAAEDAKRREKEEKAATAEEAEAGPILTALEEAADAEKTRAAKGLSAAGMPSNVISMPGMENARPVPETQEEADALAQLYAELDSRATAITTLQTRLQILAGQLGLANAARAVIDRKLLSQEKAAASLEENAELKKSLTVKGAEISILNGEIEKLNAQVKSLGGDRDILAKEEERIIREREDYAKSHEEKDKLLNLAAGLLAKREEELTKLRAQVAAAKSAKPEPVAAQAPAPAEPVAAKEAPAPAAAAEVPAAAPEPLRGSPGEGLPATVAGSSTTPASEEPGGYSLGGPAVSL